MHRPMTLARGPRVLALASLGLAACGDPFSPVDPFEPCKERPPIVASDVTVTWSDGPADPVAAFVLFTPNALQRALVTPRICLQPTSLCAATLADLRRGDEPLVTARAPESQCYYVIRDEADPLAPGDHLAATFETEDGARVGFDLTLPDFALPLAHHALSALQAADGTTWSATVHHGLVGVTRTGQTVRYAGVATSDPWDPSARGPQSDTVLALAPAGPRAMWLATAATGLSWFDPGPDARDRRDDVWVHGQPLVSAGPPAGTPKLADELAQTALALAPDPRDPDGVWVATLDGLYHARRNATAVELARMADGPALAVAVDDEGLVWAGFSTQAVFRLPADEGSGLGPDATVLRPPAEGALLVLDPGVDPHDASDDGRVWAMADEDAVTAVLPELGRTWIGTPYGVVRAAFRQTRVSLEPAPALLDLGDTAVTALAPARDGLWIATRGECALGEGKLVHAQTDVAGDLVAATDLSTAGFGERDFASVRELASGAVLVSTLVPRLTSFVLPEGTVTTARACEGLLPTPQSADLYELAPDGGGLRRFGAP